VHGDFLRALGCSFRFHPLGREISSFSEALHWSR
jgi:hypothetical protein